MAISIGDALVGYAAGISTVVALRQIVTDLPSVTATIAEGERVGGVGYTVRVPIYWATITNAGRRPITIKKVGFVGEGRAWMSLPMAWIDAVPFTLAERAFKDLMLDREGPNAPTGLPLRLTLCVQDSVGRWWPRRIRPRLWRKRFWRLVRGERDALPEKREDQAL